MRGLLFSQMSPPADLEAEFHDWYDNEHIPVRLALPGFGSAVRYRAVGDATEFLVCYYIDDLAVLESHGYEEIKRSPGPRTSQMLNAVSGFTRYTCELVSETGPDAAGDLLIVHALDAHPEHRRQFEDAYGESSGEVVRTEVTGSVQLYRTYGDHAGRPFTHLALYQLAEARDDAHSIRQRIAASMTVGPAALEQAWWAYRAFHREGPSTLARPVASPS